MHEIQRTNRTSFLTAFWRLLAVGLSTALLSEGIANAREWRKTVSFPSARVTLQDQIKLPEVFNRPPGTAWIVNGSDTKRASVPRFELPADSRINSVQLEFSPSVTAFPMMFSAVNPSNAEARLQSFRYIDAAFHDRNGVTDPSNQYKLFGYSSQTNMPRVYSTPYDNTSMPWHFPGAKFQINSAVITTSPVPQSDPLFDFDLTLSSFMRMTGTWSGRWTGFVNVFEESSLSIPAGTIKIDYGPSPNSSARGDGNIFSSTDDSRGQLGGDAVAYELNFGTVRVGTSATKTVELKNIGVPSSKLVGTIGGIADAPLRSFSVAGQHSFRDLLGGEADSKAVAFTPTELGVATTYLAVETGIDDFYFPMTGVGSGPLLEFGDNQDVVDFGVIGLNDSKTLSLTLWNSLTYVLDRRGQPLEISGLTINRIEVVGDGFQVLDFSPFVLHDGLGYDLERRIEIEFASHGRSGGTLGRLRIFTDQGAVFGSDGEVFEVPLKAFAVPSPDSGHLAVAGILALLALKPRRFQ